MRYDDWPALSLRFCLSSLRFAHLLERSECCVLSIAVSAISLLSSCHIMWYASSYSWPLWGFEVTVWYNLLLQLLSYFLSPITSLFSLARLGSVRIDIGIYHICVNTYGIIYYACKFIQRIITSWRLFLWSFINFTGRWWCFMEMTNIHMYTQVCILRW